MVFSVHIQFKVIAGGAMFGNKMSSVSAKWRGLLFRFNQDQKCRHGGC